MTDDLDLYHEMREACAGVLASHGIKREHCRMDLLISREQARNAQIRAEYEEIRPRYGEAREVREALARKWGLSESYLERILYCA